MARPIEKNFQLCPQELSEKYSDATLTTKEADHQVIKVHRVFLAKFSCKLESLFDETNSKDSLIIVRNIKFEILSAIVDFLYSGKVLLAEKSSEFIEDFLDGVTVLKIDIGERVEEEILEQLKKAKAHVVLTPLLSVKQEYSDESGSSSNKHLDVNDNKKRFWSESISSKKIKLEPEIKMARLERTDLGKEEYGKDLRGKLIEKQIKNFRNTHDEEKRASFEESFDEVSSANSSQNTSNNHFSHVGGDLYVDYNDQLKHHMDMKHKRYKEDHEGYDDDRESLRDYHENYRFNPKYCNADPRWNAENQVG